MQLRVGVAGTAIARWEVKILSVRHAQRQFECSLSDRVPTGPVSREFWNRRNLLRKGWSKDRA